MPCRDMHISRIQACQARAPARGSWPSQLSVQNAFPLPAEIVGSHMYMTEQVVIKEIVK